MVRCTYDKTAEAIYMAYPRRAAKGKAIPAIVKALSLLSSREEIGDPVAWLTAKVEEYAAAVATWPANELQYVPYPATWFNQWRYDDDPAEWKRKAAHTLGRVHDSTADEFSRIDGRSVHN